MVTPKSWVFYYSKSPKTHRTAVLLCSAVAAGGLALRTRFGCGLVAVLTRLADTRSAIVSEMCGWIELVNEFESL